MASIWEKISGVLPYFASVESKDIVDVLIVATILYLILVFVKQTKSFFVFNAFLLLFAVIYVSNVYNLSLTRQVLQPFLTFFIFIFVVIFQREIRRFFEWFYLSGRRFANDRRRTITTEVSAAVVDAIEHMATRKIGAIIVLAGDEALDSAIEGGFSLDGRVSEPLLLSIFDPTSPGHDGAVIIENNRIKRFGVHLPLADNFNKKLGTRHRAAVGVTERTDSMSIIVSEERGTISVAEHGVLTLITDTFKLETAIKEFLKENLPATRGWRYLFMENLGIKVFSVVAAIILWAFFA